MNTEQTGFWDVGTDKARKTSGDRETVAQPLAETIRPVNLDEILGQEELLGNGRPLRQAIETDSTGSMILWGPPGSGKTTLARVIAKETQAGFRTLSATDSGKADLRKVIEQAKSESRNGRRTILFIDEIHRWNKAQQDALLPHVESGLITLIGATTENPSFEVISALLSRVTVFVLKGLSTEQLCEVLRRGIAQLQQQGPLEIEDAVIEKIAAAADHDARSALNQLERLVKHVRNSPNAGSSITLADAETALSARSLHYDKSGEEHYNLISALHKSLRDSNPQAALYWLTRMLESGEDPRYVSRRLIRFASEDVGLADPQALPLAIAGDESYRRLGSPEGELALVEVCLYLACAPKSNAAYVAHNTAKEIIKKTGALPVPKHIRNAPTALMKNLDYGKGYQYAHDDSDAVVDQEDLPPELKGTKFYRPTDRGYETEIRERLLKWHDLRKKKRENKDS